LQQKEKMISRVRLIPFLIAYTAIPSILLAQNNFSPAKESFRLFNKYKPTIERKNHAIVDDPQVIIGDINGDQKVDCIISFVMTSKDGGNLIIGHESAIYLNRGSKMKVVGAFPKFDFCYGIDHIKNQVIYAKEYECSPPYNKIIGERKFIYQEGKIRTIPQ
jgi:hypothetical protein